MEARCLLSINEFPTPTPNSGPDFITAGPDGNVWFTEKFANKIGQVTPGGLITEFPILTLGAGLWGITTGSDGNIWFTESLTNKIGRIMPDGTHVAEFSIPSSNSFPTQITTAPDGDLWFIETGASKMGRLEPTTGRITEFPVNSVSSGRTSLVFGSDGNLWFTESSVNLIGRITPDGSHVIEVPIPTPNSTPVGITLGPDGNIWFTESNAFQIARINPYNFSVREFPVPTYGSGPEGITTGLDGNLWFTETNANKIGRVTLDGNVTEFPIPTSNSLPAAITSGPDGNIWFTEQNASKIGEVVLTLPASHFLLSAAASTSTAGTRFGFTITALDAVNRIVPGYTGTVHFSSSDLQASLPVDYTFTASDNGAHTFSNVTLFTAGTQTVTAKDTASEISGSVTITVTPSAPPVDHFSLSAPATVVAGNSFAVMVTALDVQGQVTKGYTGTVMFSSSDPFPGLLPSDYTFTQSDNGSHTFSGVSLFTAGEQTLTAQDATFSSIVGSAGIKVLASSANHFFMIAPATIVAGISFDVTIGALDPYGNLDKGYTGTVLLTSSDRFPHPTDYTLTAADGGMHTFVGAILFTAGAQTLIARDALNGSLGGTAAVAVSPAPANHFLFTAPASAISGMSFDVIVTALDPYGNTDTSYQGSVTFTTSDPNPGVVLPAKYTFASSDDGVHAFHGGVTLISPGDQFLAVTETISGITGSAIVTVGSSPTPPPGGAANNPSNSTIIMESTLPWSSLQGVLVDRLFSPFKEQDSRVVFPSFTHSGGVEVDQLMLELFRPELLCQLGSQQ